MADLAYLIYAFLSVFVFTVLFQVTAGAIHLLYYSPISHIPGPKLAALTFWYLCNLFLLFSFYSFLFSLKVTLIYISLAKEKNIFADARKTKRGENHLGMSSITMSSSAGSTCFISALYMLDMVQ